MQHGCGSKPSTPGEHQMDVHPPCTRRRARSLWSGDVLGRGDLHHREPYQLLHQLLSTQRQERPKRVSKMGSTTPNHNPQKEKWEIQPPYIVHVPHFSGGSGLGVVESLLKCGLCLRVVAFGAALTGKHRKHRNPFWGSHGCPVVPCCVTPLDRVYFANTRSGPCARVESAK